MKGLEPSGRGEVWPCVCLMRGRGQGKSSEGAAGRRGGGQGLGGRGAIEEVS